MLYRFTLGQLIVVLSWCSLLAAFLPFGPWKPLGVALIIAGMTFSVMALLTRWFRYVMVALGIALIGCIALEYFSPVMVAVGRAELQLEIHVADSDSTMSIPNALIEVIDPDIRPNPKVIVNKRSDAHGQLIVILPLTSVFQESRFRHWEGAYGVSWYTIQVSADGYHTSIAPLKDVVGRIRSLRESGTTVKKLWNAKLRPLGSEVQAPLQPAGVPSLLPNT